MFGWLRARLGRARKECPECHSAVSKQDATCQVCGYDIVRDARAQGGPRNQ